MTETAKSDISYRRSDISSPFIFTSICESGDYYSLSDFFHEAVQILCSTLTLEESLEPFFRFLQRHVPVNQFVMGRDFRERRAVEIIAYCTAKNGVKILCQHMAHSEVQMGLMVLDNLELWKHCDSPTGVLVTDADHPLMRYYNNLSIPLPDLVEVPMFFLRMQQAEQIYGGAAFTFLPGTQLTTEQMERLRILRTPLFIALKNWAQFRELEELKEQIWQENLRLRRELKATSGVEVIGEKNGLKRVMDKVRLAGPVDVPVLITGETGTGKEVIARAVHELSPRSDRPFVAVNCGGIPSTLIDSELFGHVKGAFTGATNNHKGRFERAHGGTIFLDEIAELPLDVQARLLRVLQERSIERVGGSTASPVDFRLIAATNRDLREMVQEGTFREDLYYRLRVVSIHLPPLRERPQDIPLLVEHFLRQAALRFGIVPPSLGKNEMTKLMEHAWPGNVRELQNVLEEALVLMPEGPLRFWSEEDVRPEETPVGELPSYDQYLKDYFTRLLQQCGNKIGGPGGAAERAGLNANTLRSKLDKLHIEYHRNSR